MRRVDRSPPLYPNLRRVADSSLATKGSCCGSNKARNSASDNRRLRYQDQGSPLRTSRRHRPDDVDEDMRQALQQRFGAMDQETLDSVRMQHPTHLGSNGILMCGCGCGRPTVDCADCFRDMYEFVEESQASSKQEELEYEGTMNVDDGLPPSYRREPHQHQENLTEQEEALRLRRLEQEQMEMSKLRPAIINQQQLDSLDDEDWSFVDEIRTDPLDSPCVDQVDLTVAVAVFVEK
ncbi:hypothetical protein FBU30_008001 [Linnemannia zychae]|nr:hypothetical protein FBU30_008001 [Linnemannia zychae]